MKFIVMVTVNKKDGFHEHREFAVYRDPAGNPQGIQRAFGFIEELMRSQVAVPEAAIVESVSFNVVETPEEDAS